MIIPEPKFSVGEVVQVLTDSGEVYADEAELISREYHSQSRMGTSAVNGTPARSNLGWHYRHRDHVGIVTSHESRLRRLPPTITSWDELLESLPKIREVETA